MSKIEVNEIVNQSGDNDSGIDLTTNDQIGFKIANASKWTLNSSGNLFPASTSQGIVLGATSDTSANRLDDYEHGNWTPAVGGSTTYTQQVGKYVKVGEFVYLWFYLVINAHDGSYGANFSITGNPFTTNSTMGGSGNIHYFAGVGGGNPVALFTRVDANNTQINVSGTTGAASSMANVNHNWANTNGASIYGNCQLYVA